LFVFFVFKEYWEDASTFHPRQNKWIRGQKGKGGRQEQTHWIRGQKGKGGRQEQTHWIRGQKGGRSFITGKIRTTSRNVRFLVPSAQPSEEFEDDVDETEQVDNEDEEEDNLDEKPSQMVDPTNTTLFFKFLPEELLDYKMFQRWIGSAGVDPDKINLNSHKRFAHVRFKTHVNILELFSFFQFICLFLSLEINFLVLKSILLCTSPPTHPQFILNSKLSTDF
jgi:hypothetical protein